MPQVGKRREVLAQHQTSGGRRQIEDAPLAGGRRSRQNVECRQPVRVLQMKRKEDGIAGAQQALAVGDGLIGADDKLLAATRLRVSRFTSASRSSAGRWFIASKKWTTATISTISCWQPSQRLRFSVGGPVSLLEFHELAPRLTGAMPATGRASFTGRKAHDKCRAPSPPSPTSA